MRRRSLTRRLVPPLLIAASVLVGVGCGVINPELLGAVGASNTAADDVTKGMVVVVLINGTDVSTEITTVTTKMLAGVSTDINKTITAKARNHTVLVDDCELDSIQVTQASYAGTNGAVIVPSTVSPANMGENLQCGGGLVVTLTGAPPGVFLNAYSF
jgi:hypothetical protein